MWTQTDVDFLEKNYLIMSQKEIGKRLKKPVRQVKKKIEELGLDKKYQIEYAVYYNDDFLFIGTKQEIMERFGFTRKAFSTHLCRTKQNKGGYNIICIGRWEKDK
mgnify:CR=1 FL=1